MQPRPCSVIVAGYGEAHIKRMGRWNYSALKINTSVSGVILVNGKLNIQPWRQGYTLVFSFGRDQTISTFNTTRSISCLAVAVLVFSFGRGQKLAGICDIRMLGSSREARSISCTVVLLFTLGISALSLIDMCKIHCEIDK